MKKKKKKKKVISLGSEEKPKNGKNSTLFVIENANSCLSLKGINTKKTALFLNESMCFPH